MTPSHGIPVNLPPTIESWVAADRALAADRMRDLLSPGVTLVSPLTDAFDFTGPDDVAGVFAAAFEVLADVAVARVTGAGADWAIHATNTVNGRLRPGPHAGDAAAHGGEADLAAAAPAPLTQPF